MLRISPAITATQASHYYRSEFARGDYYTEDDTIVASKWAGNGAANLGLNGAVRPEDFAHVLAGQSPLGRTLVPAREGKTERRAAWDITISPHKSVSLVALVHGDQRVLDAHDQAVEVALAELERHAQAWASGGRETVTTGSAIIATFRHETSRAVDPQLHTHCVVMNMTQRGSDWRALQEQGLFRAQKLAREVYEAELARGLMHLGYDVRLYRDGRHGCDRAVGIAGFDDAQLRTFSRRSQQIERELARRGLDSRLSGEVVAVKTRAKKLTNVDREALRERWRETAREVGIPRPIQFRDPRPRPTPIERNSHAREGVRAALAHLAERRSVFPLAELHREALIRCRGTGATIDDIRRACSREPSLVIADQNDARQARVTTARAIDDERTILTLAESGKGHAPTLAPGALDGRALGDDQQRVVRHILETPDAILAVEGKAGTGKSHTLAAVRELAAAAGWTVRGFAPTTTAVSVLREIGLDSHTIASALAHRGIEASTGPELWIVDEASLLSSAQARRFLTLARDADAKVALVGDRGQHRAVEAGSPFELLIERGAVSVARLDTIRRQQDASLRTAVVAASETAGTSRAVTLLEQQGRVIEIEDQRERHQRIAADFVADGGRGIVIAPSNAERADLNRRIREGLIEAGQVERHSFKTQVVVKQDFTAEQRTRASNYAPGDVLRFMRRGRGIEAGERLRVTTVDEEHNRLVVESRHELFEIDPKQHRSFEVERVEDRRFAVGDRVQFRERDRALDVANGTLATIRHLDLETGQAVLEVGRRRVSVDLRELRALDYAYAVTSHRSQGLSRERIYLTVDTRHSDELVNRRQFYVSVSRAVQDARVYTDDRAALARAVSREQTRENALSIAGAQALLTAEPASSQTAARPSMIALPKSALDVAERNPRPLAISARRRPSDPPLQELGARLKPLDAPQPPRLRDHEHDR